MDDLRLTPRQVERIGSGLDRLLDRVRPAASRHNRSNRLVDGLGVDHLPLRRMGAHAPITEVLDRIATPREQRRLFGDDHTPSGDDVARLFCLKEAAAKALGTGIGRRLAWHDLLVCSLDPSALEVTSGDGRKLIGASAQTDDVAYAAALALR